MPSHRFTQAWERLRPFVLLILALAAIGLSLSFLRRYEPLHTWLFFRFAFVYVLTLYFGLGCWCTGHVVVGYLTRGDPLPCRERVLSDFAVGVLLFAVATVAVGLVHGLGGIYFWTLPGAFVALGARQTLRDVRRILRRRHAGPGAPASARAWQPFVVAFGAIALVLVYLPLLTTDNVAFDSRWYHLGMAEHFATSRRIGMFPEGWFVGAYPHLSSWLYTWAMSLPVLDLHARIELAAHQEFLLFLVTLAAVPLLVQKLLHGRRVRGSWVTMFLFPGLFLYDSNLNVGADHILAFWSVPLALATLRFARAPSPRRAVLLGALAGAAAMTKAQSTYLLAGAALVVFAAALVQVLRKRIAATRLSSILVGPGLGSFLAASAAHWLTNLVWYHNPVYPFLGKVFPSRPWREGLNGVSHDQGWSPTGSLGERLLETAKAPFTFAYVPHDWATFHGDVPVFGFLFTLSLLFLPFLRGTRRVWALVGACLVGLLIWYWTFHQDRYLQALVPWMAASVAALFALAWRLGLAGRLAVASLVVFQVVSSADVPFLPTHAMMDDTPVRAALKLLSSTFKHEPQLARDAHSEFTPIAQALPEDAKVLLHVEYIRLGLGHPAVMDNSRWVGAPLLGNSQGPASAWQQLRDMGVTHIAFRTERCHLEDMDLQSELATHLLAVRSTKATRQIGGWTLGTLSTSRPAEDVFTPVAYLGCATRERVPWHDVNAVYAKDAGSPPAPHPLPVEAPLFEGVNAAVVDTRCPVALPSGPSDHWVSAANWKSLTLWIRQ